MAEAFNALYDCNIDEDSLLTIAERVINLQHLFNIEQGQTFHEYCFPERFYTEQVDYTGGKRDRLNKEQVARMIREYCLVRGWDDEGNVSTETLARLEIKPWMKQ